MMLDKVRVVMASLQNDVGLMGGRWWVELSAKCVSGVNGQV